MITTYVGVKWGLKKVQARTGFEPMTSTIPVQHSTITSQPGAGYYAGSTEINSRSDCRDMKIIYMNCGWRNEYESDPRSYEHYLSNGENKAWKKIQARKSHEYATLVLPITPTGRAS